MTVAATSAEPIEEPTGTRPFAGFEWLLAWRYLRPKRRGGFVSVIAVVSFVGIMLGVMALIIVMAVMNGFRQELLSKILGASGHIIVQPLDGPLSDYDEVTRRIREVARVRSAIPFVEGQAFASGAVAGQGAGVLVRGLTDEDILRLPSIANNITMGSLDQFAAQEGIVIGRRLADNLGVRVGDRVTLLGPDGPRTPFGATPRRKTYSVTAIFHVGMSDIDQMLVYMPFAEAQAFFNQPDRASAVEVFVDDPDRVDEMREAINAALPRPVFLTDWRTRNAVIANALQIERNVMFLLLTLIILVATLNIVAGLFTLVREKTPDIAILRTMGASRGAILRIFLIVGSLVGSVGTLAGFLAGVTIALNLQAIQRFLSWLLGIVIWDPTIRFLAEVPAAINTGETLVAVAMGLLLSLLATIYPAWRAATLDPVDALRYE